MTNALQRETFLYFQEFCANAGVWEGGQGQTSCTEHCAVLPEGSGLHGLHPWPGQEAQARQSCSGFYGIYIPIPMHARNH